MEIMLKIARWMSPEPSPLPGLCRDMPADQILARARQQVARLNRKVAHGQDEERTLGS